MRPLARHRATAGGLVALAASLAAVALAAPAAAASSDPANVQWETYLPALGGPLKPQPHGVPHCRKLRVACIDVEIQRMRHAQQRLGCDHRAVFATTYLELTRQLRETLAGNPRFFRFRRYLFAEDALFADVYFNTLHAYERGEPVPEAWRIAFDTARSGDVQGGQDMLLGINAHVQNDMPFVIAALGQRTRTGVSRKPDHDKVNLVLDAAYERVVDQVAARYDPLVSITNASWNPVDDVAGLEMVKEWREQVWRNAERLLAARSDGERQQVADEIHANAAMWARGMASEPLPGNRARRDAYCAKQLAGGA